MSSCLQEFAHCSRDFVEMYESCPVVMLKYLLKMYFLNSSYSFLRFSLSLLYTSKITFHIK